jgi:hypothetical protein
MRKSGGVTQNKKYRAYKKRITHTQDNYFLKNCPKKSKSY